MGFAGHLREGGAAVGRRWDGGAARRRLGFRGLRVGWCEGGRTSTSVPAYLEYITRSPTLMSMGTFLPAWRAHGGRVRGRGGRGGVDMQGGRRARGACLGVVPVADRNHDASRGLGGGRAAARALLLGEWLRLGRRSVWHPREACLGSRMPPALCVSASSTCGREMRDASRNRRRLRRPAGGPGCARLHHDAVAHRLQRRVLRGRGAWLRCALRGGAGGAAASKTGLRAWAGSADAALTRSAPRQRACARGGAQGRRLRDTPDSRGLTCTRGRHSRAEAAGAAN